MECDFQCFFSGVLTRNTETWCITCCLAFRNSVYRIPMVPHILTVH